MPWSSEASAKRSSPRWPTPADALDIVPGTAMLEGGALRHARPARRRPGFTDTWDRWGGPTSPGCAGPTCPTTTASTARSCQVGPGAEVEASRGCPYSCSFCAKIDFRDRYRRRDLALLLAEIDGLIAQGVEYVYFIDEIFLPQRPLLEALCDRRIEFGVQTRIDLWKPDMLALLGAAGCVSIEAGVESLTEGGRAALDKRCRLTTDELADLLILARRHVPFVQANLLETKGDDEALVAAWRDRLRAAGVWANDPVPLYPYPSSPDYRRLFGLPDEAAWERAHSHYLGQFSSFSDIQEGRPVPLQELEQACRTG